MGNPVNMNKLKSLSKKYKLYLLEDYALAVGAKIDNKHVDSLEMQVFFSFYPVKHITTGEGGMIILKILNFLNCLEKESFWL